MAVIKFPKEESAELNLDSLRLDPQHLAATADTKVAARKRRDFLHEDMIRLGLGLDTKGRVWAYLLQQQRMRPGGATIPVSNAHMARLGVDRWAKVRALRNLEQDLLIRVEWRSNRLPRAKVLV